MRIIQKTLTCKVCNCIPARIVVGMLCATGVMELYMTRSNFSLAIVAMVRIVSPSGNENATSTEVKAPYCVRILNNTSDNKKEQNKPKEIPSIKMTSTERGNVLSAFFYAYGISATPGGRLAELYGTKKVFVVAGLVDAIGNFLIPIAAKTHYGLLFFLRFMMGLFQGPCYPSLHCLTVSWIPANEVSRFVSFVYACSSWGTIFTLITSGVIISDLGWEAVFYISGTLSLVWVTVWTLLMHNTPAENPRILEEEKRYIEASRMSKIKRKIPWLKMLQSIPLWAIHIAQSGNMFGMSILLTQQPIFMASILGISAKTNGLLSSLSHLSRVIGSVSLSWTENFFRNKYKLRKKTTRIILTFIGFGGPGICLVLIGYVGCNTTAVTALFMAGMFFNGATTTAYGSNHIDITPNFAGTASGMSTTVAFLYSMIGPVLVGALTKEEEIQEWRRVFWIVFANYIVTGGIFIIFMSTEIQSWNDGEHGKKNKVKPVSGVKIMAPYEANKKSFSKPCNITTNSSKY